MQRSITIVLVGEGPQEGREMRVRALARRGSMVLPEGVVVPWLEVGGHFQRHRFRGPPLSRLSLQLISSAPSYNLGISRRGNADSA